MILSAFGAQSCLHQHSHLLQLQRDSLQKEEIVILLVLKENLSSNKDSA